MAVPSGPLEGAPTMVTVGGTGAKLTLNMTGVLPPWPSVAVMVTCWTGDSSAPVCDQVQVPPDVPVLVSVPPGDADHQPHLAVGIGVEGVAVVPGEVAGRGDDYGVLRAGRHGHRRVEGEVLPELAAGQRAREGARPQH